MQDHIYTGSYAGHPVRYQFLYRDTHHYFDSYLTEDSGTEADLCMTPEYFQKCREILGPHDPDSYVEYKGLISLTSQYMLKYSCCIIHSVSLIYNGYAWLFAGPSGTGKTTQYTNWKTLYPEEITMLCGDMPLLELGNDQKITVHPTAWNGKENIGTKNSAPLGGIIFLKQGKDNVVENLSPHESIVPVFKQYRCVKETEQEILTLSAITECIVKNYPVWKFTNRGDYASAEMIRMHIGTFCRAKGIL